MVDENLDDVIADLIDDETQDETLAEPPKGGPGEAGRGTVALTERAADQVRSIKEKENLDDDLYLRVAVEGGGCSGLSYKLGFDHKTEDDSIVESQGVEIVIDHRHKMYLEGIQIDYPDGLDARGFTFDNPNATESCGCGTSFAI
ncbi:MAG: HesB/IscA family protein [Bacteroidota bacterium]